MALCFRFEGLGLQPFEVVDDLHVSPPCIECADGRQDLFTEVAGALDAVQQLPELLQVQLQLRYFAPLYAQLLVDLRLEEL